MLRPCALGRCALLSGENVFGLLQWALRGRGRVATAVISPDWQRRARQTSNQQLSMRLAAEGFRIGTSPPVKTPSPVSSGRAPFGPLMKCAREHRGLLAVSGFNRVVKRRTQSRFV
ncbi:hypothetical protein ROHU_002069 [Labeo rohita]|uniref:Uncharacterized protein n=1 Tax=Labeo rohita TaxID=84645 RepID=A0A498P1K3_LABRO|nr:hypothetical protein ROHU_002069 [Labeo rohita]